ncbi:MAG: hypothetical protein HYW27_03065 [Candidatus Aenigmarchaeota archaeon]|nr:hypothetical protein [Candidatus Aenigmarchaeota archaeon]
MDKPDSYRDKMSLLSHCRTCSFMCCSRGGSPIISGEEREEIIRKSGADYFIEIGTENGETYFVIELNRDGSRRDLNSDPCSLCKTL